MKMRKAQGSFEILMAIGLMIFIFIILIYFSYDRRSELYGIEQVVNEKSECHKLSDVITSTFVSGVGTNITLKLDYDAAVDGTSGSVEVGDDNYPCTLPLKSVTSPSGASSFNLSTGYIVVENINKTVVMYNV